VREGVEMKQLVHKGFVSQIVCNGQSIIVIADESEARSYVEDHLRGAEVIILPIAVFEYRFKEATL
jgi:hypothetical protein